MSDDEEDYARVTHRVPEHIRDAAQAQTEHGELSELVRKLYKRVAFGEAEGGAESVQIELERVRAEKDEVREKHRNLQQQLQSIEQQETRLEEKLTKHRSKRDKYEGHLESLEEALYAGAHLYEDYKGVKRAGRVIGKPPAEVLLDLRDRNPEIPEYAFRPAHETDETWSGIRDGRGSQ